MTEMNVWKTGLTNLLMDAMVVVVIGVVYSSLIYEYPLSKISTIRNSEAKWRSDL